MSSAANPKANQVHPSDAAQEPTGAIASDSLAAESIKAGGAFSENDNAAISSVKGANSTLNNSDTSAATVLPAAKNKEARAEKEAKGLGSDERGTTGALIDNLGQAEFSGTHSSEGYVGGASAPSTSTGTGSTSLPSGATGDSFADGNTAGSGSSKSEAPASSGSSAAATGGKSSSGTTTAQQSSSSSSGSKADTAPNYAGVVSGAIRPEGEDKPKGKNLVEGDIPETKTFTGDVGGVHDPGRLATKEFNKTGPGGAASAGAASGQQGNDKGSAFSGGQFDVLSSERA